MLQTLIDQLLIEHAAAVEWQASYNPGGRDDLASREEYGRRQGYVSGLARAIDQASELNRTGTIIVAP